MASLTPGVLSKLVENAGNKEVRVTGQHRSALLQVIEIVPSLSPSDHTNPWHSKGFFLKLSDSLHCAYVSISQEDLDLVYSDKIQLGQFVYVSHLDLGSPVPVLRGLKPVPKRRDCVGSPKDLVSTHLLPITSTSLDDKEVEKKKSLASSKKGGLEKNVAAASVVETRRLSLDSARRIWDHTPLFSTNASYIAAPNFKPSTNGHSHKKALLKNGQSLKSQPLSVSPLKSKNDLSSTKTTAKPVKKDTISSTDSAPTRLLNVPLNSETCSDQRVSWSALLPTLQNIGKETVRYKNAAILAAARTLEEASASESVIRCMQAFGDLCKSSRKVSLGSLVEQYLDLHQDMLKAAMVIYSLLHAILPEPKSRESESRQFSNNNVIKATAGRHAVLWVHAAIETNLSEFTLCRKTQEREIGDKYYHVILESSQQKLNSENKSPQSKPSSRKHGNLADLAAKAVPQMSTQQQVTTNRIKPQMENCAKENGLKEAVSLAEKLLLVSRKWFMEYIDNSLSTRMELSLGKSDEVAHLLRQLKRVDQWLNDLVGNGVKADQSVKNLRKKIYDFLLEQVDSAKFDGKKVKIQN